MSKLSENLAQSRDAQDRNAARRDLPDIESRYTRTGEPSVRLTPNMKAITS